MTEEAIPAELAGPQALMPQHTSHLGHDSLVWLERLSQKAWAQDVYLAGSSALALYVGHRTVSGLDIMCPSNRLVGQDRRDLLGELLELDSGLRVETARDGYLYARAHSSLPVRFFYYPYPLIEPEEECNDFLVASPLDLGLMKLAALISRGSRRDFVDLYLLGQHLPLEEMLERASDKFGHVIDFKLQALKALADLSLVDGEPMPKLTAELSWPTVSRWLRDTTRRAAREHVGLNPPTQSSPQEAP